MTYSESARDIQRYARLAGALGILSIVGGGIGEAYVPGIMVVAGDAVTTASRILQQEALFRWGFAAYLLEALCDASLTAAFWVLFRSVHRPTAVAMVVFRIIATCGFAVAMMLYFGALTSLRSASAVAAFDAGQVAGIAFLLLRVSAFGQSLFSLFYGVGLIALGVLVFRSGFLPRWIGVLTVVSGAGFAVRTLVLVVAPAMDSPLIVAGAALAMLPLIVRLVAKGVDLRQDMAEQHSR